jgi:sigma-B regulation protein RsbU (phosphoserine phosphatase)
MGLAVPLDSAGFSLIGALQKGGCTPGKSESERSCSHMPKNKLEEAHTTRAAENASSLTETVVGEAVLIQKSLLPREPLRASSLEVTHLMQTFSDVGGDFLDYFFLTDGKLGLYVGDVVGKGLPAAMYGALAAGGLRAIHKTGAEPAAVLELFNRRLRVRPIASRYCTTQYAVYDPVSRVICIANAGLPLPLHFSARGCQAIGEGGLPSGLFDRATYEQHKVQLAPGDAVLFTTDGLSEAQDKNGEPLDMERLIELCAVLDYSSPEVFLRSLFDSVEEFNGGRPSDDMTAAVLKILSH